jgi:processive 1,2-diacylglycerol beta-glucosyltransferase
MVRRGEMEAAWGNPDVFDPPMSQPSVLIVSAANGTGHLRAAEAVRGALAARDPGVHVEHVELLSIAPRWVRAFYGSLFEKMVEKAPRVWKEIYRLTDGEDQDSARWAPLAHRTLFREFRRLLLSRRWNVCISTHFLPCQLAAGRHGLPRFGLVVTDFGLHRYWVQPGVSSYYVATETLAGQLRQRRVRRTRIEATGIPIDSAFAHAPSQAEARAALGLAPDRPVALVMGGGLGIGVEEGVMAALQTTDSAVQVLAVCGRNDAARDRLSCAGVSGERLRVYGHVCGMEAYMAAADVVVGKPGGLSVSESLALGKPLLLTRPIPGAEEENTRAVVAEGAALCAPTQDALRHQLRRLFTEPGLLATLSDAARRIGRPHAAPAIADAIDREYLHRAAA